MQILTGTIRNSKFGGVVAVININEHVPGYLFIQAESHDLVPELIRKGMEFHFQAEGFYGDWCFANLTSQEDSVLGFSQVSFDLKSHLLITRTSICEPGSPHENEEFVSYSFGTIRMTLPKFDREVCKPELLSDIFNLFSRALVAAPRTADQVERLITKIFANPGY